MPSSRQTLRSSTTPQPKWRILPLGDSAVIVRLGNEINRATFDTVRALAQYLEHNAFPGFVEQVPAFVSVTLYYDSRRISLAEVCAWIEHVVPTLSQQVAGAPRLVEIPVCYGGRFGEDLEFVAQHNKLPPGEVVRIHANATYLVHMLGFMPGFPYLGGMSDRIATPRRPSPRVTIPAGSVGIAGSQTGIYPLESPGGWQLIGRTPLMLFRPNENPPVYLRAGDLVRFRAISADEFHAYPKAGSWGSA